jgi:hypothetical protein
VERCRRHPWTTTSTKQRRVRGREATTTSMSCRCCSCCYGNMACTFHRILPREETRWIRLDNTSILFSSTNENCYPTFHFHPLPSTSIHICLHFIRSQDAASCLPLCDTSHRFRSIVLVHVDDPLLRGAGLIKNILLVTSCCGKEQKTWRIRTGRRMRLIKILTTCSKS